MPNRCAVPRCKADSTKKWSMFRVPSNNEQYKKWQSVIPDCRNLKQSQFVCEKHFEPRFIHRKWIKRDSDGRIVAEAPYARPVLDTAAVPTIFDIDEPKQSYTDLAGENAVAATRYSMKDCIAVEHNYCCRTGLSESRVIDGKDASPMISSSAMATVESIGLQTASIDLCLGTGEVTINSTVVGTDRLTLPRSWGIAELDNDEGRTFVFSRFVTKCHNGVKLPVTDKSMTLSFDNELRYYIYGRAIDARKWNLNRTLNNANVLSENLKKFDETSICNGLGTINVQHLTLETAFQDYVDRWHHNDCTLISKRKRCENCTTMKESLGKKYSRSKTIGTLTRANRVSNPRDQRKSIALRNKNVRRGLGKNTAVRQVHLLQQLLRD